MAHDEGFLIRFIDDTVVYVQWRLGNSKWDALPCVLDETQFNVEVALEELCGQDRGYKIGVTVDIHTDSRETAAIVWSAVEATLTEDVPASGMAIAPDSWVREDPVFYNNHNAGPGVFVFFRSVVVDVEDLDDGIFPMRLYARELWSAMNRLGWIKPLEGGE